MRNTGYYLIVGAGFLTGIVVLCICFWPGRRLDPPEVLKHRILNSRSAEEKASAARDMLRHGARARVQVRRALAEYEGHDPGVIVPLLQATMKARDWRSLPELFKRMEHPHPRIRGKAGAAARMIMGADYYFRANDPPQKRKEVLARMIAIHERMLPDLQRFYEEQKE